MIIKDRPSLDGYERYLLPLPPGSYLPSAGDTKPHLCVATNHFPPPLHLLSKPLHLSTFPPQHLTLQSLPPPPLHPSLQSIYPDPPLKGILSRIPLSSYSLSLYICIYITQQTLPKPLTSSVINELETKAALRLTANKKLHNPHSGVHKALPERSTKLTTEDPNVQLNSVRGVLNTPAHTGPTMLATSFEQEDGNNEQRGGLSIDSKSFKATPTRVSTQISGQGNVSKSVSFDGSLHPLQIKSSHVIHKLNSDLAFTATQLQKILEKRVPPKPTSVSTALSNIQFIIEQLFKLNAHISSYDLIPITPSTISSNPNYQRPLNTLLVGDNILSTVKRNGIDTIRRIQTISSESSSNPIYAHVGSSLDDVTKSLNVTLAYTLDDGHCFLHAVALQFNETPNTMQAYEFLMKAIETESTTNKNHYRNFIDENSGRLDLLVHKYPHNKIFNHATGDLIPQITSNAIQRPIHIYSERDGGIWKTIVQPTIPRTINKTPLLVHLKNYPYRALIKENNASIKKISTSR
ncbi:hypothetical protein FHG87_010369 [Trinorchestia longiramus]|nr:hypothetical protein FHG87_010369 [Trinorchestia longiramus]